MTRSRCSGYGCSVRCSTTFISHPWSMASKNPRMSASSIQYFLVNRAPLSRQATCRIRSQGTERRRTLAVSALSREPPPAPPPPLRYSPVFVRRLLGYYGPVRLPAPVRRCRVPCGFTARTPTPLRAKCPPGSRVCLFRACAGSQTTQGRNNSCDDDLFRLPCHTRISQIRGPNVGALPWLFPRFPASCPFRVVHIHSLPGAESGT